MQGAARSLVCGAEPLSRFSAALCALLSLNAAAAVEIAVSLEDVTGEDWRIGAVALRLNSAGSGVADLSIGVGEMELPDDQGTLRQLNLRCPGLVQEGTVWRCDDGRLTVGESPFGPQESGWQGHFSADQGWRIDIPALRVARGKASLGIRAADQGWSLDLELLRLQPLPLAKVVPGFSLPHDWGIRGRLSGALRLQGDAAGATRLGADLVLDRLNLASPDGRHAAENLVLRLNANATRRSANWYLDANLHWPAGVAYVEPLFLDPASGGISATARGHWSEHQDRLQIDSWSVRQPGVVTLSGTGRLRPVAGVLEDLTLVVRSDNAGGFYDRLLQPFLIGTAADDLQLGGSFGLVLHLDAGGVEQAGLDLNALTASDRQGRYSLGTTSGSVAWDRDDKVPVSRLDIAHASLFRIPTGAFRIEALFSGDGVRLENPVSVSLAGGEVRLDSFELSGALVAGARPSWRADASVQGISLEQLTTALNWPPFAGNMAGTLREMQYQDQLFRVGGGLEVTAFDGSVLVTDLQIREPFGALPILSADARLRGLDLEKLTQTFSFGRIEGRLDGEIRAIRLFDWRPDSFDMHLHTPERDDLRHRISQRAVENLTELGNGVSAGLSTAMLRLFDEFRYDRIDIKVGLRGSLAELDGIARDDGGYYLVRGAGLPRIDVIGRNRQVAWKDLVERLRRIRVEQARIE